jgi:hypothetical protein
MPARTVTETLVIRWGDAVLVGASGKDPQKDARTDEQERIDYCVDTQPDAAISSIRCRIFVHVQMPFTSRPASWGGNSSAGFSLCAAGRMIACHWALGKCEVFNESAAVLLERTAFLGAVGTSCVMRKAMPPNFEMATATARTRPLTTAAARRNRSRQTLPPYLQRL